MSLTSMLAKRGSPFRDFFEERLPDCKPLQERWKGCGPPRIVPNRPVSWGLVGAAFDYRVRYLLTVTPPERFVAAQGAMLRPQTRALFARLATSLAVLLSDNDPRGAVLPAPAEAKLARYCYLLALYESLFRAPVTRSPLFELPPSAGADDQLELPPEADILDLLDLTGAAVATLGDLLNERVIANPTFAGSPHVGGADADLILGDCLIDIKTTKSTSLDREMAYQLVGYTLLDYHDEYRIRKVGFYLARVPALITWPLDDLIVQMSAGGASVAGLRSTLKAILAPQLSG